LKAIESALAAAYKKDYGRRGQHIRAAFSEITGGADFYLVKEVVDETTRVLSWKMKMKNLPHPRPVKWHPVRGERIIKSRKQRKR